MHLSVWTGQIVIIRFVFVALQLSVFTATICVPGSAGAQVAIETALPDVTEDKEEASEESRERERGTGEDPLARDLSEKVDQPVEQLFRHNKLEPYGSVRLRYNVADLENDFDDGGSRIGLKGELQFRPRFWLLGRAEAGFNIFDSLNNLVDASGRPSQEDANFSARLIYAGVETPSTAITFGKNWSTYYQVAALTDRFEAFGGEASGTYNALTDGGSTGTGRADDVLQGRFSADFFPERLKIKPFNLNLQVQPGQSIPNAGGENYDYSFGFSAVLETESEHNFGIAYNHAVIDAKVLPTLAQTGIRGDAKALLLGTRKFGDNSYLGSTLSWLDNHETTDEGVYFDAWGWEVFTSYNVSGKWWVVGGWNLLEPRSSEKQVPDYRIRYGVLGLRYTFDDFRNMIYSEIRLDDSRNSDGSRPGNVYTVGIRWDLP